MRTCNACDVAKPCDAKHFITDRSRTSGLAYECIECHRTRKRLNPAPYIPYSLRTAKQKAAHTRRSRNYYKTENGRARVLASVYRKIDRRKGMSSDITGQWILSNIIGKACVYCGIASAYIGCDRIRNDLGHTTRNCVPCCSVCNAARMDNFTHDEMLMIGKTIAQVLLVRDTGSKVAANGGSPATASPRPIQ